MSNLSQAEWLAQISEEIIDPNKGSLIHIIIFGLAVQEVVNICWMIFGLIRALDIM